MHINSLEHIDFSVLMDCFLKAFANYFVEMPKAHDYYKKRWAAAGVRYDLSYGLFEGEQLLAFIIHAVDDRKGTRIAFNTGTGVLPAYRGRKLVKKIYEHALKDLKDNGIELSQLEVIQENKKAIRVYEQVGFSIEKAYLCFKGNLKSSALETVQLLECGINNVDWEKLPGQNEYSWDFQKETLSKSDYRFFYVLKAGKWQSYFIIHGSNGTLAQFDLLEENKENWDDLFAGIAQLAKTLRIINLSDKRNDKIQMLAQLGFENTVNQYEMLLHF